MNKVLIIFAFVMAVFCSCGGKKDAEDSISEAPALLSTSPANGAEDIAGKTLTVQFTFDQNINVPSESQEKIRIDGGASIEGVVAYGPDLKVSLGNLVKGTSYTLSLMEGAVQGYRKNQKSSSQIIFRFSTRKDKPIPEGRMVPGVDDAGWENAALCLKNMGAGWNLGNTLESNSGSLDNMWIEAWTDRKTSDYETAWGQPIATRELIHMFKLAGFNAIRIPVTWYPHMGKLDVSVKVIGGEYKPVWDPSTWSGYDVDPVWMARVKEVVDYVIDEGMYCILNVHHDTGAESAAWLRADADSYSRYRDRFIKLWEQIATAFCSYDGKLVFESFNEMLDASSTWNDPKNSSSYTVINSYNADFVATVRATGGNNVRRNLILNTYAASASENTLKSFALPEDSVKDHLCAEFHSYAPYQFAMVENSSQTVFNSACEKEVNGIFELVDRYLVSKGIPCVLGEYGATAKRAESEMCKQAACYVRNGCTYGIPCFYWMVLSDGTDRSAPKWTMPDLKDTIIKTFEENY